jgi:hypothetical protein
MITKEVLLIPQSGLLVILVCMKRTSFCNKKYATVRNNYFQMHTEYTNVATYSSQISNRAGFDAILIIPPAVRHYHVIVPT